MNSMNSAMELLHGSRQKVRDRLKRLGLHAFDALDQSDLDWRALGQEIELARQALERHFALLDRINGAVGKAPAQIVPFRAQQAEEGRS